MQIRELTICERGPVMSLPYNFEETIAKIIAIEEAAARKPERNVLIGLTSRFGLVLYLSAITAVTAVVLCFSPAVTAVARTASVNSSRLWSSWLDILSPLPHTDQCRWNFIQNKDEQSLCTSQGFLFL